MKKLFLNDHFILVLIFLNALTLFCVGFDISTDLKFALRIADNVISALFVVELIVKVTEWGLKGYWASNWNKLDAVLVALSLPSLVLFVLGAEASGLGYLMTFRVLRVFKSFRFFRFIPNISHIIKGIQLALKTSIFVLVAFAVFIFSISILSHYIFANNPADYFANPAQSLYSIFKMFTIEGWTDIPEQLTVGFNETQTFFTYLYFVIIVLVGGVFGVSLVTSIFVDAMVSDNNDELEAKVDRMEAKLDRVLAGKGK